MSLTNYMGCLMSFCKSLSLYYTKTFSDASQSFSQAIYFINRIFNRRRRSIRIRRTTTKWILQPLEHIVLAAKKVLWLYVYKRELVGAGAVYVFYWYEWLAHLGNFRQSVMKMRYPPSSLLGSSHA
jgi:hypothetical protein